MAAHPRTRINQRHQATVVCCPYRVVWSGKHKNLLETGFRLPKQSKIKKQSRKTRVAWTHSHKPTNSARTPSKRPQEGDNAKRCRHRVRTDDGFHPKLWCWEENRNSVLKRNAAPTSVSVAETPRSPLWLSPAHPTKIESENRICPMIHNLIRGLCRS